MYSFYKLYLRLYNTTQRLNFYKYNSNLINCDIYFIRRILERKDIRKIRKCPLRGFFLFTLTVNILYITLNTLKNSNKSGKECLPRTFFQILTLVEYFKIFVKWE